MEIFKTRLVLVDDHPMTRMGVKHFVATQPDLELVGEAETGTAALECIEAARPDLAIVDLHLPDMPGLDVARRALQRFPGLKILIFSGDSDRVFVDEALKAGVHGYILKSSGPAELSAAIQGILSGRLYFSNDVSSGILEDYRRSLAEPEQPAKPALPERDIALIRLIASGRRNKEIASELGLTAKSVETYRSRLMKKLGVNSTADLVRYAVREGIISA